MRVAVARAQYLGVEQLGARAPGELGMRDVEAGVDHGHGLAGPRRFGAVGADHRDPPLGRDERVTRGRVMQYAYGPVGLGRTHEACPAERRQDPLGRGPAQTPDPEASRNRLPASERERDLSAAARDLDERERLGAERLDRRRAGGRTLVQELIGSMRGLGTERGAHENEGDQGPDAQPGQNSSDAGIYRPRRQSRRAGGDHRARPPTPVRAGRRPGGGRLDPARDRSGRAPRAAALPQRRPRPSRPSSPRASCSIGCSRSSSELGRTRGGARFGPRTIDLDLLVYGERQVDEPGLTVPHPRLARAAVRARAARRARPGARRARSRSCVGPAARATIERDVAPRRARRVRGRARASAEEGVHAPSSACSATAS